jgi:hypothetical protein
VVRNPEACVSKGATVQTHPWGSKSYQQPFTAPPEGWTPKAPCVLEPKASSDLLQVSPPHPRGGLRRRHEFVMPRHVCNYVSILCLFLRIYPSCGQLFSYLTSSLSCVILSQAGLLEVPTTYLGSLGYFLVQGPMLLNDCSSKMIMLNGGTECATCLAWSCTLSVCTLPH